MDLGFPILNIRNSIAPLTVALILVFAGSRFLGASETPEAKRSEVTKAAPESRSSAKSVGADAQAVASSEDWASRARKHLPAWISFGGQYRGRAEAQTGRQFQAGNDDLYYLSRLRFNLEVRPNPNLSFYLQAQDSHAPGLKIQPHPPAFTNSLDLRQGYVELRTGESKSVGLKMGRQELIFGAERLVGAGDWVNTARTFDGARAYFSTPNSRLDVFAVSVTRIRDGAFDSFQTNGNNFYGVYGSFKKAVPASTFEPFLLYKTGHRAKSEKGSPGSAGIYTFGARLAGQLPASFDYGIEAAGQAGTIASDPVRAWAGHGAFGYTLKNLGSTPRFFTEYDFASGDKSRTDGKVGTFDQLFPTNHNKYGTADLVGWRNIHSVRAGSEFKLRPKIKASFDYLSHWLAKGADALYGENGAPAARFLGGDVNRHVGHEFDFVLQYAISKQYTFGLGHSYLWAGRFLRKATPGGNFSYPYLFLTYNY